MLYLVEIQHLEKIDNDNLKKVISFVFKDYPDIIAYYIEYIELLDDRPDLINLIKTEIINMLRDFGSRKDDALSFENKIVETIRKNFVESNNSINANVNKKIVKEMEANEEGERIDSAQKVLNELF